LRVSPELTALENLLVLTTSGYDEAAPGPGVARVRQDRVARRRVPGQPPVWPAEARGLHPIRRLRDQGQTVLLVEHDMKVVTGLCETGFVLDHGEQLAEGAPDIIQADGRVIEAHLGR
jgi:hypothetical protein